MNKGIHGRYMKFLGIPIAITTLCGHIALGYAISKWIFLATGTPSELVSYIFSSIIGIGLIPVTAYVMSKILGDKHDGHKEIQFYFINDVMKAMKKIAQGDFDISIPVNETEPFNELAVSVNKMAQELGSMEKLRQDFISNVSHEIQSPLTSISGFAALLRNENATKRDVLHYATIIETESRRLSNLSGNLLKLSTLEADVTAFKMNYFRLDKQIESVLLMLEPQWVEKYISPDVSLAKIHISGNEDLLSEVWINLLHNAIKFTPEHGIIKVALSEKSGEIHCVIADNGIGISKEDQIHIFERFYKVDKSRDREVGGNGLGLSLVKKIVQIHNGSITVESKEGKGTEFTIRIPIWQNPAVSK